MQLEQRCRRRRRRRGRSSVRPGRARTSALPGSRRSASLQQRLGHGRVGLGRGFGAQRVDLGHLLADVLVEEGAHLAFGQRAHELVHRPAADEQHHQRNAADLQRGRDLRRLVGVELGQHEAAAVVARQLLQDRLQVAAGAAPRRPAVQQHRHVERALEHGLAEIGLGDVEGQVGAAEGGFMVCRSGRSCRLQARAGPGAAMRRRAV